MILFSGLLLLSLGFFYIYLAKKDQEELLVLLGILTMILGIYCWLNFFLLRTAFSPIPQKAVLFAVSDLSPSALDKLPQEGAKAWIHNKYKALPQFAQKESIPLQYLKNKGVSIEYIENKTLPNLPALLTSTSAHCIFIKIKQEEFEKHLNEISLWISQHPQLLVMVFSFKPTYFSPLYVHSSNVNASSLTSNSTRRASLVVDLDIEATILSYFHIGIPESLQGSPIQSSSSTLPLSQQLSKWKQMYFLRYGCLGIWILILLFWMYNPKPLFAYMLYFFPALGILSAFFFESLYFYILFMLLALGLMGVLLWKKILPFQLFSLGLKISFLLYCITILWFPERLYASPFGYNNLIAGGRFYGVNNDFMGILVGTALVVGYTYEMEYKKNARTAVLVLSLLCCSPFFGANAGGMLTVLFLAFLWRLKIPFSKKPLRWFQWALVLGCIFLIELLIGSLDILFSKNLGHLGKFLLGLLHENLQYDVFYKKLKLALWMFLLPPWNLLLFLEAIYIKKERLYLHPVMDIAILTGIFVAVFNDTGIISACFIVTYSLLYVRHLKENA